MVHSRETLLEMLQEQEGWLQSSAAAFDAGNESEAKRMAVVIRTLVHNTGRSKSLLAQMGLQYTHSFSSAATEDIAADVLFSSPSLASISLSEIGLSYRPKIGGEYRKMHFQAWWDETILVATGGHRFSRRSLVLGSANKDGGAHVDSDSEDTHHRLVRENLQGWMLWAGDGSDPIPGGNNPVPSCLRTMADEMLDTLSRI